MKEDMLLVDELSNNVGAVSFCSTLFFIFPTSPSLPPSFPPSLPPFFPPSLSSIPPPSLLSPSLSLPPSFLPPSLPPLSFSLLLPPSFPLSQLSEKWQDSMEKYQIMLFESIGKYKHAATQLEKIAGTIWYMYTGRGTMGGGRDRGSSRMQPVIILSTLYCNCTLACTLYMHILSIIIILHTLTYIAH